MKTFLPITLILLLLLTCTCYAQTETKMVRLMNKDGKILMQYTPGSYLMAKVADKGWVEGVIQSVDYQYFQLENTTVAYSDILRLNNEAFVKPKKRGGFIMMGLGVAGVIVASALIGDDMDIFDVNGSESSVNYDGVAAVGVASGLLFWGGLVTVLTKGKRVSKSHMWSVIDNQDELAKGPNQDP